MKASKDFIHELYQYAECGKHRQFQYLRNWQEYTRAKQTKRVYLLLVTSLNQSLKKQFKKHCTSVKLGEADITRLLAYCATKKMLQFYEDELKIIEDMIYEYDSYLMDGYLFDAWLFNSQRPDSELYDRRE